MQLATPTFGDRAQLGSHPLGPNMLLPTSSHTPDVSEAMETLLMHVLNCSMPCLEPQGNPFMNPRKGLLQENNSINQDVSKEKS